jgi:hypothetical protein
MSSLRKAMNDDVESLLNEFKRRLFNSSITDQTIIDAFIVLHDECCSSTRRREKTIAEFIEHGSFVEDTQSGSPLLLF